MQKTAIVVDDEPDIVEVFSELLEERGISIMGKGYNGNDAVDLYTTNNPNIVFIDIMMPDSSGLYAIKKIRAINKNAIIIAVTADVSSQTKKKLEELHVNHIAYKPIDMDKIMKFFENV
jgi:CheY-like chemotaxis protein